MNGRRLALSLVLGSAAALVACAAPPNPRGAPYAASSFADYHRLDTENAESVDGQAVSVVAVKPEEVVRVGTDSTTLRVAERTGVPGSGAEVWRDEPVKDGVAILRAGPTTSALLFLRGQISHVWQARPFEPGYYWFEHEATVIAWADGPISAPFPEVASPHRIDRDAFARLDKSLARAVGKGIPLDAAQAIRRIAALRAVRALRPVEGFPYATDAVARSSGKGPTMEVEERELRRVSAGEPVELDVEGPGTLHVWARAQRDNTDEVADFRVMEGSRERATGGGTVLRRRLTTYDPAGAEGKEALASLRRAIVQVPPGPHHYRVESRVGSAFVFGIISTTIEHIEDRVAGTKSETALIARAREACSVQAGANAPCLYARALAGDDNEAGYATELAKLDEEDRAIAETLASGGPRDPTAGLELSASAGDAEALKSLANALSSDLDENVRGAYERAVGRGTAWVVTEAETTSWTLSRLDPKDAASCSGATDFTELSDTETVVRTTMSHDRHIVSLLVDAPCADKRPIQLEVDGQKIRLAPLHQSSLLHVGVIGESAKVRVLDAAGAHLRAVVGGAQPGCEVDVLTVRAPRPAKNNPTFEFGKEHAPGLEVWLKDTEAMGSVDVTSTKDPAKTIHIAFAHSKNGLAAIDENAGRWTRAARVLLPEWAAEGGVRASGPDNVAVRAIGRETRFVGRPVDAPAKPEPVETLSEPALVEATHAILKATKEERGNAFLSRAMMLARAGAEHAALEDAQAAEAFGVEGAVARVRAAVRRRPITTGRLAKVAYGVEPDFDAKAVRCLTQDSPRVKLAALEREIENRGHAPYDAELAVRAADLAALLPEDPRAEHLLARATARGRWKLVRDAEGVPRVARPDEKGKVGPLDAEQELRPRVLTGAPFGTEDFASVTAEHPARASLGHVGAVHARVDFACAPRVPWDAKGACPFEVVLPQGKVVRAPQLVDGKGTIDIPQLGKGAIELRIAGDEAKWTAVARIGFDRNLPGTREVDGLWVLEVPHLQYRYLLHAGQSLGAKVKGPALVRVDSLAEPDEQPGALVVSADGKEETVAPGESKVVGVRGGSLALRVRSGAVTVQIAERVPLELGDVAGARPEPKVKPTSQNESVDLDATLGGFRDTALKSPAPLSPLQDALGTISLHANYVAGTLREGAPPSTALDQYFTTVLEYRRRIEAIDLTYTLGGVARIRGASPTESGYLILYEDEGHTRLRATATGVVFSQQVNDIRYATLRPRGFLEYSARVAQDVFILPRLGFDGYYSNAPHTLASTTNVDDDVFNAYRSTRQSMAFAQLLGWWEPSFNTIFYVRARGTADLTNGVFNNVSGRPGILSVFGQLEADAYFDATYYPSSKTDNVAFIPSGGIALDYNGWVLPGSLALVPLAVAVARFDGGGYQLTGGLQVITSFRRGLRDFTSLELSFPEQTAGGIPWRGEPR